MKTIEIGLLEWQKEDVAEKTWDEALEYANGLGCGWRLPTIKELISLIDFGAVIQPARLKIASRPITGRLLPAPLIPTTRGTSVSTMAMSTTTISRIAIMRVPCAADRLGYWAIWLFGRPVRHRPGMLGIP